MAEDQPQRDIDTQATLEVLEELLVAVMRNAFAEKGSLDKVRECLSAVRKAHSGPPESEWAEEYQRAVFAAIARVSSKLLNDMSS